MDVHSEQPIHCMMNNATTPGISNGSSWRNEDSGYHTFTPSSFESSVTCNESLDVPINQTELRITGQITVDCYNITPLGRKLSQTKTRHASLNESPAQRRGVKRRYNENMVSPYNPNNTVPTPTSAIAGGIQKLKVNDESCIDINISVSSVRSDTTHNVVNNLYYINDYAYNSYPTTPVKKICRPNCKLSPSKRSSKKINFAIHSLSCESEGIETKQVKRVRSQSKVARTIQFRPDQKVDIIKMLYDKVCVWPAINKIIGYLSNKDIYNFTLVSPTWLKVWEQVSNCKKLGYSQYLKDRKKNTENINKPETPLTRKNSQMRSLKDIHNVLNTEGIVMETQRSPPSTPRTVRFKKFIKSASLDSRVQIVCVRCCQPSKVTEEPDGEHWAECTSSTCSYQFCRFCKCIRHPGKICFKYDLEGPSPSKRKKSSCVVGTKSSRKNLRRLL